MVEFNNVAVRKSDVLGAVGNGWDALEKMAVKSTVAKAAEMIGGCKTLNAMTADYTKEQSSTEQADNTRNGVQAAGQTLHGTLCVVIACLREHGEQ